MLRVEIGRPAAKAQVTLPAGLTQMGVASDGSLSEPAAAQNRSRVNLALARRFRSAWLKWHRLTNGDEGGRWPVAVDQQPAGRCSDRSCDVACLDAGHLQRQRLSGGLPAAKRRPDARRADDGVPGGNFSNPISTIASTKTTSARRAACRCCSRAVRSSATRTSSRSETEMLRDPLYAHLNSFGLRWFAAVGFFAGSALWGFSIQRTIGEGAFDESEKAALAGLSQRLTETATLSTAVGRGVLSDITNALGLHQARRDRARPVRIGRSTSIRCGSRPWRRYQHHGAAPRHAATGGRNPPSMISSTG